MSVHSLPTLIHIVLNRILPGLAIAMSAGCAAPNVEIDLERRLRDEAFREGVAAANTDLRSGVLAYEDIQCEEEEGWRILWCFRKLLKDRHHVDYRVISPSPVPGAVGRMEGYQSVVAPILKSKLGDGWQDRTYNDAKELHRDHWPELEALYEKDREADCW